MQGYLPMLSAMLVLTSSVVAAADPQVHPPAAAVDYTEISAAIAGIDQLAFPRARLVLQVNRSENTRVLNLRGGTRTLTAYNFFWPNLGRIDFEDPRNVGALAAYYLLQGDEIRAKLFRGTGTCWYIYGISRVGCASPSQLGDRVKVFGDLELTLEFDRASYNFGEPVPLVLAVKNIGRSWTSIRFSSGQRYDFVVTRDGREVWRWSKNKVFIQALGSLRLSPGETIRFRETWRQEDDLGRRVTPGVYRVTGVLTTTGTPRPTVGPVGIEVLRGLREIDLFDGN